MNNDQIRIAIAGVCGWKWHGDPSWPKHPDGYYWKIEGRFDYKSLPNYPEDLNACAEMEKGLTLEQRVTYSNNLAKICGTQFEKCFATAPQRCEAFLRTLNLWKEEDK